MLVSNSYLFIEEATNTSRNNIHIYCIIYIVYNLNVLIIHNNDKADKSSLATVATSGSYNDLSNKPTIPTALSQLTADSTHRLVTDTEKSTWNNKQDTFSKHTYFLIADDTRSHDAIVLLLQVSIISDDPVTLIAHYYNNKNTSYLNTLCYKSQVYFQLKKYYYVTFWNNKYSIEYDVNEWLGSEDGWDGPTNSINITSDTTKVFRLN